MKQFELCRETETVDVKLNYLENIEISYISRERSSKFHVLLAITNIDKRYLYLVDFGFLIVEHQTMATFPMSRWQYCLEKNQSGIIYPYSTSQIVVDIRQIVGELDANTLWVLKHIYFLNSYLL